jgi:tRNA(His) 5'-end guanylyltransferase
MGKTNKDSLGDRMKEFYENRSKTYLTRRTPVIIRLDGKAFHSFTKGFKRPYDEVFHEAMNNTMKYLCANIQGCKLGYTQSDEITLLLTDYTTLTTDAWFGYGVQKMCSIAASMATLMFNKYFRDAINKKFTGTIEDFDHFKALSMARDKGAMFDARCFNIPQEEVANCFIWRQQDATRNAIQMLGQTNFTHKELQGKSCSDIQDMLMLQKGINFNDMPAEFKRGVCCVKEEYLLEAPTSEVEELVRLHATTPRTRWVLDKEIPIFTQERDYIEKQFIV